MVGLFLLLRGGWLEFQCRDIKSYINEFLSLKISNISLLNSKRNTFMNFKLGFVEIFIKIADKVK